jgi:hypothetical protein
VRPSVAFDDAVVALANLATRAVALGAVIFELSVVADAGISRRLRSRRALGLARITLIGVVDRTRALLAVSVVVHSVLLANALFAIVCGIITAIRNARLIGGAPFSVTFARAGLRAGVVSLAVVLALA